METTTRLRPARDTAVEGLFYLFCQVENYGDVIHRYVPEEMEELFTAGERARLGAGEVVVTRGGGSGKPIRWTDLVAAARQLGEGAPVSIG